jgi:hypothetical protein
VFLWERRNADRQFGTFENCHSEVGSTGIPRLDLREQMPMSLVSWMQKKKKANKKVQGHIPAAGLALEIRNLLTGDKGAP